MAFGPAPIEDRAVQYDQKYSDQLDQYTNQAQDTLNQTNSVYQRNSDDLSRLLGQLTNAQPTSFTKGQTFAERFGALVGGISPDLNQARNLAKQLSGEDGLYSSLSNRIDQNAATKFSQAEAGLQNDLANRGLGNGGAALAALAQLRGQTSIAANEQANQAALQVGQMRQQGLQAAGGLYNQIAGLGLQSAQTEATLGLQGYQTDANLNLQSQSNRQSSINQLLALRQQGDLTQQSNALGFLSQIFGQQSNYNNNLTQQAQASAQSRGDFWGNILGGLFGLVGTIATGGGKRPNGTAVGASQHQVTTIGPQRPKYGTPTYNPYQTDSIGGTNGTYY